MAIYLTKLINLNDVQILDIKFHKKLDFLAISVIKQGSTGQILIANNQGDLFSDCTITKNVATSAIKWHPSKPLLAMGWVEGQVAVWNEVQNNIQDAAHVHILPIACLEWSSLGTRLLSADIEGHLNMWKVDNRGTLSSSPIVSFDAGCAINCVALRVPRMQGSDVYDIRELARAAVNGDQRAMDLMSRSSEGLKFTGYAHMDVANFFLGLADGRVILINEDGKRTEITLLEGSVINLLYHEERDVLISTTDIGMLTQHQLLSDGNSREVMKVKLACRTPNPSLIWAGPNTLAIALGEPMIRMWDIDREENFTLQPEDQMGYRTAGLLPVIDYCASEGTLVAGSSLGQVVMWKLTSDDAALTKKTVSPETLWCLQPPTNLSIDNETSSGSIEKLVASSTNMIAASTSSNAMFLLEERPVISAFTSGIVVTQKAAKELFIELFDCGNEDNSSESHMVPNIVSNDLIIEEPVKKQVHKGTKSNFTVGVSHFITNMEVSKENIAISDGRIVYVYELKFDTAYVMDLCGSFNCESPILKIHQQNLFVVDKNQLQIRNFQGTIKQIVDLGNMDGTVQCVNINNNFMVCSTSKCYLRTFDLSRRDPKPMSVVKDLGDCMPSVTMIKSVAINSTGNTVSLIIEKEKTPDPKVYFWDIETDTIQYFNFSTGFGEQDDYNTKNSRTPSSKRTRTKSGQRSARQRNRRRQMKGGQGDTAFSVTKSILYNEEDEDNGEEDAVNLDAEKDVNDEPHPTPDDISSEQLDSLTSASEVSNSLPLDHCWDMKDPRLVVVYIKSKTDSTGILNMSMDARLKTSDKNQQLHRKLVSLFSTQDDGILMFDNFPFEEDYDRFVGFEAPYYFFMIRGDTVYERRAKDSSAGVVSVRTMRDFVGLDMIDRTNKQAMLNFSYYLTIGNMDEAFRAMKLIKTEQVWQNMAKMCVKTRRLDVAAVCLGKMNYGRAAMELREARQNITEPDARMAMLALHLNMKDEAISLLRKSERYDLLNDLYQAMEEWDRAIEVALTNDRIHLKTTYYNYARYLEEQKRYSEAIDSFVKSGTHAFQVPRMLFDQPEELEKFIRERPEKSLRKWWAQYMECCGEMKIALEFYAAAQDYLSLVRAYWLLGMDKKATEVCNDTGDRAACYHLARQFEAANNIDNAIHYFSRAKAYNSAIRLCKENRKDDHLVNLALLGKPEDQVDAATYLQTRPGYEDKAVMLFHKAGQVSRAVDLAFTTKQFGALQHISGDLSDTTDPNLVQKCAAFFMENHQFDRAVDLLASSKQLWEALKLCVEYNVPMTEELAEKLTPAKSTDETERCRLLEGVGEIALSQGAHHLACKKFTQAGNHMMAMKALLRSGDTGKITFFANVAKSKEVYLLAANYLQTLDWHRDPDIVKSIIQFYTKGKSPERLAAFYEACAQSEIDEHRDYGNALQALTESFKYWSKATFASDNQRNTKLDQLKDKCTLIKKFIVAVDMVGTNPDEGVQQCQMLLDETNLDRAVRYGDVYAVMVRHFMAQSKFKAAYSCLEEMRRRVRNPGVLTAYLDGAILEALHGALGLPYRPPTGQHRDHRDQEPEDEDDIIDDQVAAAIDDDM